MLKVKDQRGTGAKTSGQAQEAAALRETGLSEPQPRPPGQGIRWPFRDRHQLTALSPHNPSDLLDLIPGDVWTPAYDAHDEIRDRAWVAELTGLLDMSGWPEGMRVDRPYGATPICTPSSPVSISKLLILAKESGRKRSWPVSSRRRSAQAGSGLAIPPALTFRGCLAGGPG